MNCAKLYSLATLTALLALATTSISCRSRAPAYQPTVMAIPLMDGAHVASWTKEEAAKVPALAAQARLASKFVYVGSDNGLLLLWGLSFEPPADSTPSP